MVGNIFTRAYGNHQNDVKEQAIYKRKYNKLYCTKRKCINSKKKN